MSYRFAYHTAVALVLFVFGSLNAPVSARSRNLPAAQSEVNSPTDTYARYFFTAEAVYQDIVILNNNIKVTYFKDAEKKCAQWIEQRPCWTRADLLTREARLTKRELQTLRSLIKKTEFLMLDSVYGGAKDGQRHYTETVKVSLGFVAKEVKYQSFPEAAPRPAAFEKVKAQLLQLAKKKFGV